MRRLDRRFRGAHPHGSERTPIPTHLQPCIADPRRESRSDHRTAVRWLGTELRCRQRCCRRRRLRRQTRKRLRRPSWSRASQGQEYGGDADRIHDGRLPDDQDTVLRRCIQRRDIRRGAICALSSRDTVPSRHREAERIR